MNNVPHPGRLKLTFGRRTINCPLGQVRFFLRTDAASLPKKQRGLDSFCRRGRTVTLDPASKFLPRNGNVAAVRAVEPIGQRLVVMDEVVAVVRGLADDNGAFQVNR